MELVHEFLPVDDENIDATGNSKEAYFTASYAILSPRMCAVAAGTLLLIRSYRDLDARH